MLAAVFPGQGSQYVGMGADWFKQDGLADFVKEISEACGRDIGRLCLDSDADTLRATENAQLALFACGYLAYQAWIEAGGAAAEAFAGHSIGEYAALAASGAIGLTEATLLVKRRGEIMAGAGASRPGTMAAVLGLERAVIEKICSEVTSGVVVVANDNCPGQLVVSGDVAAVEAIAEPAKAAGAKRVLPLNVSGAFHSPLMASSARKMGVALHNVHFTHCHGRVYSNVLATSNDDPMVWPDLLERQLENPVRWTESVQAMAADGARRFLEFGAGDVLCGLIRRIVPDAQTASIKDIATLEAALNASLV
jgi:[acyl-carrier-protein] S-malonyltransferase